jgi:short-subunit dehydrogenase
MSFKDNVIVLKNRNVMKAENKKIVVTGGGNGMGREIVLNLLAKGSKVVAVDVNEKALMETTELAGEKKGNLSTAVLNITDKAAVEAFAAKTVAEGPVDGLINDAGIVQPFVTIQNVGFDVVERIFNVNFWGTLYMIKSFLPHLLTRPEAHIVNVSSMGGFLPVPGQAIYGASKAAVKILTESLKSELEGTSVKVTVIFPGAIRTHILKNSGLEENLDGVNVKKAEKMTMPPAVAAQQIVAAMEQDKPRLFLGKDSKTMNLFYKFAPLFATHLIGSQIRKVHKI